MGPYKAWVCLQASIGSVFVYGPLIGPKLLVGLTAPKVILDRINIKNLEQGPLMGRNSYRVLSSPRSKEGLWARWICLV